LIGRAWQFVRHIARLNEAKKFMMSCSNYLRNRISKIPIRITANWIREHDLCYKTRRRYTRWRSSSRQ